MPAERWVAGPGRLDVVLTELSGQPRADVQRAIAADQVLVDDHARAKSHRLLGGEELVWERSEPQDLVPEGPPVPLRYEDEYLVIVAKPAGLLTHPTRARRTGTLVNRLLAMGVPLAAAGGPLRPGIVHRLDSGTSGLMVVAKTDEAFAALQAMLRRHEVARRYLALVRGQPAGDAFGVEAPLGRRAARVIVDRAEGRAATTAFEVKERLGPCTLLEATPETGRTHQIRVHLSSIGLPILGDRAYGGAGDDARSLGLTRPFLHSCRIAFSHPITGLTIEREEPLPDDLAEALARARHDLGA